MYAVVFEIAIKIIWAIDKRKEIRKTHDILTLYKEISEETRSKITNLYDAQVSVLSIEGKKRNGSNVRISDLIDFQTLEEALESNHNTITNFKYDRKLQGKSSAISGLIWNHNDTRWTLPQGFVTFPEQLLAYAKENLKSYMA